MPPGGSTGPEVTVTVKPNNESIEVGKPASLICKVKSVLPPSIKWLKRLRNDELGKGAYDGYNVINVGPNRYQFLDHERVAKLSIDEYQAELQIKASRVDDAGMYICFVS